MTDLTIAIHEPLWTSQCDDLKTLTQACVEYVLQHQQHRLPDLKGETLELAIIYTDSREIQDLNHRFRNKDAPTNVLSFAADKDAMMLEGQPRILGDIILSYQVIAEEAEAQQKPFKHHSLHMLIHGLLHLLGYDHMYNEEAEIMEQTERDILTHYAIPDPYRDDDMHTEH